MAGQRTLPMLRALAAAPEGLTTPQLAELASSAASWVNALGTVRQLMLKQERLGRVRQAGTVPGDRTRSLLLWRITGKGEQYVKEAQDGDASPVMTGSGPPSGPVRVVKLRDGVAVRITHAPGTVADEPVTEEITLLDAEWAELTCLAGKHAAAVERERLAAEHGRAMSRMLEGIIGLMVACGDGSDAELLIFGRLNQAVLHYAYGKIAAGEPLTPFERDEMEEDAAYREDRLFYRATPDGRVVQTIVPRPVAYLIAARVRIKALAGMCRERVAPRSREELP